MRKEDYKNVSVEAKGIQGCFTTPEFKAERVSYEVITPSAARGILDSIYWHPGMTWEIDKICVIEKGEPCNIGITNEISCKPELKTLLSNIQKNGDPGYIVASKHKIQRNNRILRNIHYRIDAHVKMLVKETKDVNAAKFASIMRRRIKKGQCYRTPYFGMREYEVEFAPPQGRYVCPPELRGIIDFGEMFWDFDYENGMTPITYHAVMVNGIIIPKHQLCRKDIIA